MSSQLVQCGYQTNAVPHHWRVSYSRTELWSVFPQDPAAASWITSIRVLRRVSSDLILSMQEGVESVIIYEVLKNTVTHANLSKKKATRVFYS